MKLLNTKKFIKFSCIAFISVFINFAMFSQCITTEGGAIINEFSNGPIKNQEFIEILVIGNETGENVNLQGYILDDNNEAKKGVGNEPGHVILGPCFSSLSSGQLILIYNDKQPYPGVELLADDPTLMLIPFNDPCIIKMEGCPNHTTDSYDCGYQVYDLDANWNAYIAAHNYGDKIQLINKEKETVHAFEWGLPIPSKAHSTQRKSYIHSSEYTYTWDSYKKSTPGKPNNFANFEFIQNLQSENPYENLNSTSIIECTSIAINISGGFINYTYLLQIKDQNNNISNLYSGISSTGEINFSNLECGDYTLKVTDKLGCTINTEFTISAHNECYVQEPPNQLDFGIGDQCSTCQNINSCFEWESSSGNTFGLAIPTGKNITLPYDKGIELKDMNGYLLRKEYDLKKAKILSETKYWFNENDIEGVCSDSAPNGCSGIDSDGDGICDSEDSCPDSQENDDSDIDGICNIFDCDPNDPNESIDSDGDGVCDGLDCAPEDPEYSADSDNDGQCDNVDCAPFNALKYSGAPCDDNNQCTRNDTFDAECNCVGESIPNCINCIESTPCDDGKPCTKNDKFDADCNCIGQVIPGCIECKTGTICDDNNACTKNDSFDENCACKGIKIPNCKDCQPEGICDDGNACTYGDKFDVKCNCIGIPKYSLTIETNLETECNQSVIKLKAIGSFKSYYWYKNSKQLNLFSEEIRITSDGRYSVEVETENGCIYSEAITINADNLLPSLTISASNSKICSSNKPETLSINDDYKNIKWYFDDLFMPEHNESKSIEITKEGVYKAEVEDIFGCIKIGTIKILSAFNDEIKILPEYPIYCGGNFEPLRIELTNEIQSILWSTGATSSSISPTELKEYSVTVTNNDGCIAYDNVSYQKERNTDIEKILLENGFRKERILISEILPSAKGGTETSGTRNSPSQLNEEQVLNYQIKRLEYNSNGDVIDLGKYCQQYIDDYYCYDAGASGILLDNFCSEEEDNIDLNSFIEFSRLETSFSFYLPKTEPGVETFLYVATPAKDELQKTIDHEELFLEVLYTILCNKQKAKNTYLDKHAKAEFKQKSSTYVEAGSLPEYNSFEKSISYIESGPILLPSNNSREFYIYNEPIGWDGSSFDTYGIFGKRGFIISNYIQGGILLTNNPDNIEKNTSSTVYLTIDGYKDKVTLYGDFYEIRIPYEPNSIGGSNINIWDGNGCVELDYMTITVSKNDYESGFNGLFNNTTGLIDRILDPNDAFGSKALEDLPACLFDTNQFCDLIQSKYQNLSSTYNGPLQYVNKILRDDKNKLTPNFSKELINCFNDNNLVDDYYDLATNWLKKDRVDLLENLTNHYYLANPTVDVIIPTVDKNLVHLTVLEKDNDAEGDNKTKLTYDVEVYNNHLKYSNSWAIPTIPINLDSNDPPSYAFTYALEQENDLRYFDSDITTPEHEGYLIKIGKDYNYLSNDQKELYFEDQYKMARVPGIYVLYALEKRYIKTAKM